MAEAGPSTHTQSADIAATTFKRLHPTAYLSRFLDSGIREDGRSLSAFRETTVSLGSISTADGSAFVRIGNTSCVAAIKAEIATPQLSRPTEGYLIPNIELPAVCSSKFKPGAPGDEAQILTDRVLSFLNSSGVMDREKLCLESSKAVWCLYLDVSFICFDGNGMDAAILASLGALINTTLPKATFDADFEEARCSSQTSDRTPLSLQTLPLSVNFGVFDRKHLISDPTAFESALIASQLTIGIEADLDSDDPKELRPCYIWHSGSLKTVATENSIGKSDRENVQVCIKAAEQRYRQLRSLLQNAHKA